MIKNMWGKLNLLDQIDAQNKSWDDQFELLAKYPFALKAIVDSKYFQITYENLDDFHKSFRNRVLEFFYDGRYYVWDSIKMKWLDTETNEEY